MQMPMKSLLPLLFHTEKVSIAEWPCSNNIDILVAHITTALAILTVIHRLSKAFSVRNILGR